MNPVFCHFVRRRRQQRLRSLASSGIVVIGEEYPFRVVVNRVRIPFSLNLAHMGENHSYTLVKDLRGA